MVSNDCKEKCRDFGMLVENIICMADCYEEPIEKFRKCMFYKPEFEDKEKIILDMIDTSNRISEEIKLLSIEDLRKLQDGHGIELIGYTDMLATALRREPYSNNDVKYKCDAIMSIVLDMLHRELRDDTIRFADIWSQRYDICGSIEGPQIMIRHEEAEWFTPEPSKADYMKLSNMVTDYVEFYTELNMEQNEGMSGMGM